MSESTVPSSLDDAPTVSTATRVLVGLTATMLIGGLVVGVFLLRTLIPTVQTDPQAAAARLDSLVSIDLPDEFAAVATLDWSLLYLIPMSGVWVEADGGDSVVSIVQLEGSMKDDPKVRSRAVDALREQSIGTGTIEKTEPLVTKVAGRERELNVLLVRDSAGNRSRVVGVDVMRGDTPLLIEIKRPAAEFDVEEVKAILASIR